MSAHSRRLRFPGTNAHPTPQAPTQVTVYPDYEGLKKSLNYYQRAGTSSGKGHLNFFVPKNMPVTDMCTLLSIKQYDPVFCLKRDLIGDFSGESVSQHSSAQVNIIKVRSALNNLCFDRVIENFFHELNDNILSTNNEKYVASIVEFLIHPVGFAKSDFTFNDSKKAKLSLTPLESENSGTISVKVQDKRSYLRHGTRVRWCVPVPSQWNNAASWYDTIDTKGKITLYVEPITPETDAAKLSTLFSGFFGNDSAMVEDFLQKIISNGSKSLIPFHSIPVSFKHLISVIYLNTIKMDIESGFLQVNNPYKYGSIVDYMVNLAKRTVDFNQFCIDTIGIVKPNSRFLMASLVLFVWMKEKSGSFDTYYQILKTNYFNGMDFDVLPLDIKMDYDFDFIPSDGFSEIDWENMLESIGDECLNWAKPLIYEQDGFIKKPITEKKMKFERPLQHRMFGEYTLHNDQEAYDFIGSETLSDEQASEVRKTAAEDFFTISAPIFGLSVPTFTKTGTSDTSAADGYHYENHSSERYRLLIEDATDRADRTITEIARTLCSEMLPQTKCERSRVGFDPIRKQNIAMTTESITHNHIFNLNTELGKVGKEISTALPQFLEAISEYFYAEEQKPKMKVIRGGQKGEKATVYFKQ